MKFWGRVQIHLGEATKGRQCPPSDQASTWSQHPPWQPHRGIPLEQRLTTASVFLKSLEGRVLAIFIKDGSKFSLVWKAMAHGTTKKQCRFLDFSLSKSALGMGPEASREGRWHLSFCLYYGNMRSLALECESVQVSLCGPAISGFMCREDICGSSSSCVLCINISLGSYWTLEAAKTLRSMFRKLCPSRSKVSFSSYLHAAYSSLPKNPTCGKIQTHFNKKNHIPK